MIKKLVKYGNSHALVLDKALLEILNISDATKLKLSTDGTSLTVTPLQETPPTEQVAPAAPSVSVTESEAEMHYGTLQAVQQRNELQSLAENMEKHQRIHQEFKAVNDEFNKKYNYGQRMMELTTSQHYKERVKKIAIDCYKKNLSLEEYNQAIFNFTQECLSDIPLKEFQERFKAFEKEYMAREHTQEQESTPLSPELQAAAGTHKKCLENLSKILENPDLFQQMAWEQKQIIEEFDKKYNYIRKMAEVMNNPSYRDAAQKITDAVLSGTISVEERNRKVQELLQSYMPGIPLHELTEANREFEKKFAALHPAAESESSTK